MIEIRLYSGFNKRINSTKIPGSGVTVNSLTGNLKEPCSIENPVIQFELSGSPAAYVYAYIPSFNRYYFINDWSFNVGLWEAELTEDYLASWKTNIGNTNAYIDRSSSESDGNIIDTQYITTTDFDIMASPLAYSWSNDGCFILGVIDGKNDNNSQMGGAVTYYVLTKAQCRALMHYLISPSFLTDNGFPQQQSLTQQLSQETAKAFVNPFQFITSCLWLPLDPTVLTGNNPDVEISVGYWLINSSIVTGKLLNVWHVIYLETVGIPVHPQSVARGEYLNFAPYTRLSLYIPPFGIIPIDPMYRKLGNYINCRIYIDPITGIGDMIINVAQTAGSESFDTLPVIYQTSSLIGVPIQIAQVGNDFIGAASSAIQAITSIDFMGAATGFLTGGVTGAVKGAIGNSVGHAANALMSLMPQVQTNGTNGSRTFVSQVPRLKAEFMKLVDEDNAELGRPLRKIRKISTLSGFIKCFEVTIDYPCFASEKETIYDFMMNGFFWE